MIHHATGEEAGSKAENEPAQIFRLRKMIRGMRGRLVANGSDFIAGSLLNPQLRRGGGNATRDADGDRLCNWRRSRRSTSCWSRKARSGPASRAKSKVWSLPRCRLESLRSVWASDRIVIDTIINKYCNLKVVRNSRP